MRPPLVHVLGLRAPLELADGSWLIGFVYRNGGDLCPVRVSDTDRADAQAGADELRRSKFRVLPV